MNENTKSGSVIITTILGSTVLGVFLGSRTGGTYKFDIGINLLYGWISFLIFIFVLSIGFFYLERLKIITSGKEKNE